MGRKDAAFPGRHVWNRRRIPPASHVPPQSWKCMEMDSLEVPSFVSYFTGKDVGVSKNMGFSPQNGWFISWITHENPIKHGMIWGETPLFLETSMCFFFLFNTNFGLWLLQMGFPFPKRAVFSWTKVMILDFPDVADSKALEKLYSDCTEYVSRKGG